MNPAGIFYRQHKFPDVNSHLNWTNKGLNLASSINSDNVKDLGVVAFWANTMKSEMPLWKWSDFDTSNIITVADNEEYLKYRVPVKTDNVIRIVKDLSNTDYPGIDDSTFEIMVDSDVFGPGTILKPSQFSEFSLLVTPDQVRKVGDNSIITVQLLSSNMKYAPKEYLTPGQPLGRFGSLRSPEYGQEWTPWKFKGGPSAKEYIMKISNAEVNASYWLSDKICKFSDGNSTDSITLKNAYSQVKQYFKVDGMMDPTVPNLDSPSSDMTGDQMKEALKSGKASMSFAYLMDDISYGMLNNDERQMLMWSPGGSAKSYDGQEEIQMPVGLWFQLKSGYIVPFNINGFNLGILITGLENYILGKKDYTTIGSEPTIVLETGRAGVMMASSAISKKQQDGGFAQGVVYHNNDFGFVTGKASDLKVAATLFTGFTIPGVFKVEFKYNAAFDNTWNASELDNPNVTSPFGTYRLSSFTFIAYDINSKKNNIFLIRKDAPKVYHHCIAGTDTHPMYRMQGGTAAGFTDGSGQVSMVSHLASSNKSGFGVFMRKQVGAIWVKDPTQVLIFLPYNPKTGKPFGNLM